MKLNLSISIIRREHVLNTYAKTCYFLSNGFVLAPVSLMLNVDRSGLSNGDDESARVELKDDIEEFVRFLCGIGGGTRPTA